jgi:hypothetical protein
MMRITDEAVEAALDVLFAHGHNGIKCYDPKPGLDATACAALEAALPRMGGTTADSDAFRQGVENTVARGIRVLEAYQRGALTAERKHAYETAINVLRELR